MTRFRRPSTAPIWAVRGARSLQAEHGAVAGLALDAARVFRDAPQHPGPHAEQVEDEHVAKAAEKRLAELRRTEQKLDRETDARERTELRTRTRLKQLQDELDRIGGAPVRRRRGCAPERSSPLLTFLES